MYFSDIVSCIYLISGPNFWSELTGPKLFHPKPSGNLSKLCEYDSFFSDKNGKGS